MLSPFGIYPRLLDLILLTMSLLVQSDNQFILPSPSFACLDQNVTSVSRLLGTLVLAIPRCSRVAGHGIGHITPIHLYTCI
jgi:hypothetical protein